MRWLTSWTEKLTASHTKKNDLEELNVHFKNTENTRRLFYTVALITVKMGFLMCLHDHISVMWSYINTNTHTHCASFQIPWINVWYTCTHPGCAVYATVYIVFLFAAYMHILFLHIMWNFKSQPLREIINNLVWVCPIGFLWEKF